MSVPPPPGDPSLSTAAATAGSEPSGTEQAASAAAKPSSSPRRLAAAARLLRRPRVWVSIILVSLLAVGLILAWPQLRAWYHLRRARDELQRWHNPQAVRHLQVCLNTWPNDPEVMLLAARAARRARSYAEAEHLLERYQQARGLDDKVSFEKLLLTAERNVDKVVDLCWRQVEQEHPEADVILDALVRGYLRQYRLVEARLALTHWLKKEPDHPQALSLEGLFHLDFDHAKAAAEESYRHAVQVDPEHEEARLGLAVALLDRRSFVEAAEHLEYLQRRQPDNLNVKVGLAECRDGMGREEEALQLADAVLAQQPHLGPALALRGRLTMKRGQFADAEPYLRRALEANPMDYRTRYNLVLCLNQCGQEKEAEEESRQLKQAEADLARFNEIVTKEIVKNPRDPSLHCTLGELLLRRGQKEEGLRWLHSALKIDPQYAPARKLLDEHQQKAQKKGMRDEDAGERGVSTP